MLWILCKDFWFQCSCIHIPLMATGFLFSLVLYCLCSDTFTKMTSLLLWCVIKAGTSWNACKTSINIKCVSFINKSDGCTTRLMLSTSIEKRDTVWIKIRSIFCSLHTIICLWKLYWCSLIGKKQYSSTPSKENKRAMWLCSAHLR